MSLSQFKEYFTPIHNQPLERVLERQANLGLVGLTLGIIGAGIAFSNGHVGLGFVEIASGLAAEILGRTSYLQLLEWQKGRDNGWATPLDNDVQTFLFRKDFANDQMEEVN
jgi:hypothetical protein